MSTHKTDRCPLCGKENLPETPLAEIKLYSLGPRGGVRDAKAWGVVHESCLMSRIGGVPLLQELKGITRSHNRRMRKVSAPATAVEPAPEPS